MRVMQPLRVCGEATRTPIESLLDEYLEFIRLRKTERSYKTDLWYLEKAFGRKPFDDGVFALEVAGPNIEDVTTADVARYLQRLAAKRKYKGKTLNRYREVLNRLCNWAYVIGEWSSLRAFLLCQS